MDEFSILAFLHNTGMVIATVIVQLGAQMTLARVISLRMLGGASGTLPAARPLAVLVAVLVLMMGHIVQVLMWAGLYSTWSELGNFANAAYFSLASFTTVGANELSLSPAHRLSGALEAAMGMLMFGWSTALLVQIVQRAAVRPAQG